MSDATPPADVMETRPRRFRTLRIAVPVFFCVVAFVACLWSKDPTDFSDVGLQLTYSPSPGVTMVVVPYWCYAVLAGGIAVLPWCSPPRFSLRTLLIEMTLIAVALGAIVISMR